MYELNRRKNPPITCNTDSNVNSDEDLISFSAKQISDSASVGFVVESAAPG